jgi:hypothetical protein
MPGRRSDPGTKSRQVLGPYMTLVSSINEGIKREFMTVGYWQSYYSEVDFFGRDSIFSG